MADEGAVVAPPAAQETTPPATEIAVPPNGDATGQTATAGRTFTQAEFDAVLKERLERADRKTAEATAKARADEQRKAAEAQGEYQKLYEATKAELEAAAQRAQALELAAMRRDVADRLGVPAALAARLQGDTPEALEADAKALMAALPKPGAPNINSAQGGSVPKSPFGDEQERLRLASLFGVSAKNFGK
jgi:uncharacterized membrane protein YqiK